MKYLSIWCALLSTVLNVEGIIETEVRLLVPQENFDSSTACDKLRVRASKHWSSELFFDCQLNRIESHADKGTELYFEVKINETKLPSKYLEGGFYDFMMWHVNQLLNDEEASCLTMSGVGQLQDAYDSFELEYNGEPFLSDYILVGPYSENFCEQLPLGLHLDDAIVIHKCHLLEQSVAHSNASRLGKYQLKNINLRKYEDKEDLDLLLLEQLNENVGPCSLNGYRAPVRRFYKFDVRLLVEESMLAINGCDLLISRSPKFWKNGQFRYCFYESQSRVEELDLVEVHLIVHVSDSLLPDDWRPMMTHDLLAWYVNNKLNGENQTCRMATGDPFGFGFPASTVPMEGGRDMLLIGPYEEHFCNNLTSTSNPRGQWGIVDCQLEKKIEIPSENKILGKYILKWPSFNETLNDPRMPFLSQLNKGEYHCAFNAYWSPKPDEEYF